MKIQNNRNNSIFQYATLYGFNTIVDPEKRKKSLLRFCKDNKVLGTFLIANEGINGTVSGQPDNIENVVFLPAEVPSKSNVTSTLPLLGSFDN